MTIGSHDPMGGSNASHNLGMGDETVNTQTSRLDPLPEEPPPYDAPAGYSYGPPQTTIRETNFISDENLLAWLAMKQDGLYGELRDHMDMSRARGKLIEDLNHLKGLADRGIGPSEAAEEIGKLLEKYEGTEFEAELNELFAGPLGEIELIENTEGAPDLLSDQAVEQLSGSIQSKIDALGRDDQLELVAIQSLTADIREAAQLASNLVASGNQTADAIVGNIAR